MKKQAFMALFQARMETERAAITQRMKDYAAKGCSDDAMLERIRLNICDALEAVVRAGAKAETMEGMEAFCKSRFQTIPGVWQKNLEAAIRHGDVKAQAIEQIKVYQAGRIIGFFEESKGGEA